MDLWHEKLFLFKYIKSVCFLKFDKALLSKFNSVTKKYNYINSLFSYRDF